MKRDIMDDEQLAKIPTIERFESDLDDWEAALENARTLIDMGENGDLDAFTAARKQITGVLFEIEQARCFIALRKSYLASLTPGASTLFDDGQSVKRRGEHQTDPRLQDADRLA